MNNKKEIFKFLIKEFHELELPRVIERDLRLPRETNKIISVVGPRRVGKTFYFYQLIKNLRAKMSLHRILYINFEDDRILPLTFKDLDNLLEAYFELYPENKNKKIYCFFDEIQNITQWEIFIRRVYDKEKVQIYLTGSSSKLLGREIATALRGRTLTYRLNPLSFKEFLRFKDLTLEKNFAYSRQRFLIKNLLEEYIVFGGFPEVVLEEESLKFPLLKNYYDLLVYKDLADRFSIRNTQLLKVLLKYLITNVSTSFTANSYYQSLQSNLRVSRETLLEYLSYVNEIELISFVPLFSYSLKVQQVNPKKIYCLDNGLRNAVSFKFSQDEGRLVENLVFQELKRQGEEVYYWRKKLEVDFVVKNNSKLTAINVSYGKELKKRETNSLLEFKKEFKQKAKELLIVTKNLEGKKGKIKLIPLWKWLLMK